MPCVPANCLLCGGSASITLNRKCKYLKRRTTARLGRGARPGRVWDGFTCRKNWRRTFGFGSKSAQILHPMPSSCPMRKGGFMDTGNYRKRVLHCLLYTSDAADEE